MDAEAEFVAAPPGAAAPLCEAPRPNNMYAAATQTNTTTTMIGTIGCGARGVGDELDVFRFAMRRTSRRGLAPPGVTHGHEPASPLQNRARMAGAYVLVVNPRAGVGRAASMLRAVSAKLRVDPHQAIETSLDSSFAQRLSTAIRAAASPVTVISVGGDGTLSIIVNALPDPRAARLAIVPAGSGNDFGVALGIRSLDQALEAAAGTSSADVDLGTCNGRRFINCIGMGLDGEIARTAAAIRRRGLARGMSYYCAALVGLWRVRPVRAVLSRSTGEVRIEDLLMLTVGNGAWYGGGYHGAPGASIDDGELDCYAFADLKGPLRRLALMERVRRGTHASHSVVTGFKTSSLCAEFDREIAMHVDGELTAAARVDIGVQRAALSVAVL